MDAALCSLTSLWLETIFIGNHELRGRIVEGDNDSDV